MAPGAARYAATGAEVRPAGSGAEAGGEACEEVTLT